MIPLNDSDVITVHDDSSPGNCTMLEYVAAHDPIYLDSEDDQEGDEVHLMDRRWIKKKWLKSRSRSPRARKHRRRGETVTTEVRALASTSRPSDGHSTLGCSRTPGARPTRPPHRDEGPRTSQAARAVEPETRGPVAPMSFSEALDLWLILLGMQHEDAAPGSFPTTYQCNVISETFLGLGPADRVTFLAGLTRVTTRILEVAGNLVQIALNNERSNDMVEVRVDQDGTSLMQGEMTRVTPHTPSDEAWLAALHSLRLTLEDQNPERRCATALLLLKLLDWRCTNHRDGFVLGGVHGRAADALALLTVALDDQKRVVDACLPDEPEVIRLWSGLVAFLPQTVGSRSASNMPISSDRPPWIHGATLPDDTPPASPDSSPHPSLQDVHGDLPMEQLDHMIDLEREDMRQLDEEDVDSAQQHREMEEQHEEDRVREHILEKQLHEGRSFQQWEDWVMHQALSRPTPTHHRKRPGIEVELSSGSGDRPHVVRKVTLPIGDGVLNMRITRHEDIPTSEAETEPVPLGSHADVLAPVAASSPPPVDYDRILAQIRGGEITFQGVLLQYGPEVLQDLQVQWAMDATLVPSQDTGHALPLRDRPWRDYDEMHGRWSRGQVSDAQAMTLLNSFRRNMHYMNKVRGWKKTVRALWAWRLRV